MVHRSRHSHRARDEVTEGILFLLATAVRPHSLGKGDPKDGVPPAVSGSLPMREARFPPADGFNIVDPGIE